MDLQLTASQKLLKQSVKRFVQEHIVPHAKIWDQQQALPETLYQKLAELGLLGIEVPVVYGGAGLGVTELAMVVEEIAKGDGSTALMVASHNGLCTGHIARFGNEQQKKHYLPKLVSADLLGAWALTEPGSGSDAKAMQSRAKRQNQHYMLTGSKIFITQGNIAGVYVVLAKTEVEPGHDGITAFIVPKNSPGLQSSAIYDKLGMRASDTAALFFDEISLPESALLGQLHQGFKNALSILDKGRITIAALSLGLGFSALSQATLYAKQRSQFGRPIGQYQAIQWKLADMATQLEAAKLLTYKAAWLADRQQPFGKEASMAKVFASEAAFHACNEAVQIHGGYGYTAEFPVERAFRDSKLCSIGEGSNEILRMLITKKNLQEAQSRAGV